jgi:hypothetical protein
MRIELTGCQRDTWLGIQDGSGSPVPLSIFVVRWRTTREVAVTGI